MAAVLAVTLLTPGADAAREQHLILNASAPDAIDGEFLVALADGVPGADAATYAERLTAKHGGTTTAVFSAARPGFAVEADDFEAMRLAEDPDIAFVQRNLAGALQDTQTTPAALWNLDRIDQAALPVDGSFSHAPSGVPIYVLDDGVRVSHAEFEGRARAGFSAFSSTADCSGHGTRVAGLAAGKTYGAAKQSPVIAVKVADCATVTSASVVAGLDWVRQNANAPAVVNLSVGFAGGDTFVDDAVKSVIAAGFTVVMSAGNEGVDSCTRSPARVAASAPGAVVVSATDRTDARPGDANQGACVSLFAPGVDITSAGNASDSAVAAAASGTSFAAPLVAGAAAAVLATQPAFSPLQVKSAILASATIGKVTNTTAANRLLRIPAQHQPATATVNSTLNTIFNTYGDQGGHWTGGDESLSIPLPDGRTAWFFGDTMLGTVNTDGTRPPNQPMVHNTMVIQQGGSLVDTRISGTTAAPKSLVGAADDGTEGNFGWWPGEGRVNGDKLEVFYTHVGDGGSGEFAYNTLARAVATFALPSLTLTSLTTLPLAQHQKISWGAAMVDGQDGYTYIYGTESKARTTYLKIARVANSAGLSGTWQFWTGASDGSAQWSTDVDAATDVMSGVGTGFSLKYLNGRYTLVTFDLSQPFSKRMLAFFAAQPTGPFTDQTLIYEAPEAGVNGAYAYNARIHPQATPSGSDFTVSYNVNTVGEMSNDARLYRPRFVNVKLPAAAKGSDLPAAPKGLTSTMDTSGNVRLAWTAPAGNGLTYQVYERQVSAGATTFTRSQSTGVTSLNLQLLAPGRYEFRVSARNAAGEGPASVTSVIGVDVPAPAAAPANLTAITQDDGTVKLTWNAVTAAGWVGYQVLQRDVTGGESTFRSSAGAAVSGTGATVGGLAYGHTYAFQVYAYNEGGDGPVSAPVEALAQMAKPSAPTNLVARNNDDGTIGLSWTNPNPDLWVWVYSRNKTDNLSFERSKYPVSTGSTFTAGYLEIGKEYEFYVVTFNEVGESNPSNKVSAFAKVAPPPAPTNLVATQNDDGTIGLSWDSSGDGIWYWVYYRDKTIGQAWTKSTYPVSSGTTFVAGYLTNEHEYEFKVTAIGTDSESAASNVVTEKSLVALLAAPTGVRAVANDDGTITVNWNSSGAGVWYYVWTRNTTDNGAWTRSLLPINNGTTWTAGYLTVGKDYSFQVTALNTAGKESARSATVTEKSYVPPPAAPKNLRATAGVSKVQLTWDSVAPGTWYYVYSKDLDSTAGEVKSLPISSGTSFTAEGLVNGHQFAFWVTAIGQGNVESARSVRATATPQMPPPKAPTGLTATSLTNGKIKLDWTTSGTGIWYYVYGRDRDTGGSFKQLAMVTSGTTFTADYLTMKHWYEFYVEAFNEGGTARSNTDAAQSKIPLTAAPTLTASPQPDGTIDLDWNSVGSGLWYYVYYRKGTSGSFKQLEYPITSGTAFTFGGHSDDGTQFQFQVRGINAMGPGNPSNTVTATSNLARPAAPAVHVRPDTASGTTRISWNRVTNATGYTIVWRPCGSSTPWRTTGVYTFQLSYAYYGPGQCQEFSVVADNRAKSGPRSNAAQGVGWVDDYPWPNELVEWAPDPWFFVMRQCTSFSAWRIRQHFYSSFNGKWRQSGTNFWYHGHNWDNAAGRAGIAVDRTPRVGSIQHRESGDFGHVAFVLGRDGNDVYIEEYNHNNPRSYGRRTVQVGDSRYKYIHFESSIW
jgi:surface antigen/fibronectin type 3 domain-containing protein